MKDDQNREALARLAIGVHRDRPAQLRRQLGSFLRSRREALGLRRSDVARALGYQNLSKGSRRIVDWEAGRPGGILDRSAYLEALSLDGTETLALLARADAVERRLDGMGRGVIAADRALIQENLQRLRAHTELSLIHI